MEEQSQGGRRLPSVGPALRHHWFVVVLCVFAVVGAGALYAVNVERTYTASSTVLLNPLPSSPLTAEAASGSGAQLNVALETEAQVVSSPAVGEAVSNRLNRVIPGDEETLAVEVPTGTQMVRISFTSSSPTQAQESAQAFAEEFLDFRSSRAAEAQASTMESLTEQVESTETSLRTALADADDEGEGSFASRQVDLFADRLTLLNGRVSSTEALASDPGRVLNPAERPTSSNELSTPIIFALAAVLGLVLAFAVAWYREWRTDVVRADETSNIAGLPVFAGISMTSTTGDQSRSADNKEAFRRLRVGVVANASRPHILAVGSLGADTNASRVAVSLARGLTEANYSVALVAADPEDRAVESEFGIPEDAPGLTALIGSDSATELDAVGVQRDGVTIIPQGADLVDSRDLLAGVGFRTLLETLRARHDYVIVASASTGTADGDSVIATADSLVLVVAQDRTTHQQIAGALEGLDYLGVRTLGAVSVTQARRVRSSQTA